MLSSRLSILITRLTANELTSAESQELEAYLLNADTDVLAEECLDLIPDCPIEAFREDLMPIAYKAMEADKIPLNIPPGNSSRRRNVSIAAAIIMILSFAAMYLIDRNFNTKRRQIGQVNKTTVNKAFPAQKGAILKLDNGLIIDIDKASVGVIAQQGGLKVIKQPDGSIAYEGENSSILFNEIASQNGQAINLHLPDNTSVTLNAASSIRYPLSFSGKERLVDMTGEAYFQVAPNKLYPFRVKVKDLVVEDIGTSFNVNAYSNEPNLKTTLIDGAVRVKAANSQIMLKPGEQAVLTNGKLTVHRADIPEATAWLKGYFQFNDADLPTVLRQLERWYQIKVVYTGKVPERSFGGGMERSLPLEEVLKILERNNVQFKLDGNELIISPN